MENVHTFQKNKILLNVGGHRFETSLHTLTAVAHTYIASMFSGYFPRQPNDDDGAYFINRDGRHFHHVLNFLRQYPTVPKKVEPFYDVRGAERRALRWKWSSMVCSTAGCLAGLSPRRSQLEKRC